MRRYYFAYYSWSGSAYPVMWVEEGEIPIGGHPKPLVQGPVEITEKEFSSSLLEMTSKYPLEIDMTEVLRKDN